MKMEMTSVGENISFQVMIKPYLLIDTKTIFPLNIYFII